MKFQKTRRVLSLVLALLLGFTLWTPTTVKAANVETQSSDEVVIAIDENTTLKASGWSFNTIWESSDTDVATVSNKGVVTGVAPGTVTITATSKGFFWGKSTVTKFTVRVVEKEESDAIQIKVGESITLPAPSESGTTTCKSSDTNIATASEDGVVTGLSEGTVTIIATTKSGGHKFWFFCWGETTTTTEYTVVVTDDSELSEDNLHAKFAQAIGDESELYFLYDDYDGNGSCEAFGITGDTEDGIASNVHIWFVSSGGNTNRIGEYEFCGYLGNEEQLLQADSQKFVIWEANGGGSGSTSYIFGVRNGEAYEPNISSIYEFFEDDYMEHEEYDDCYVGYSNDFSAGYHQYPPHYFKFDPSTGEFIETDNPNTYSNTDVENLFEILPYEFTFSSGAGFWETVLNIESDGTFNGQYLDSDMGDSGTGYPNGTVYICDFSGKFTKPQKINEYTYSMNIESLNVKETSGTVYYENNTRYIVADPYGFDNADEFFIYLPGATISKLPEGFLSWVYFDDDVQDTLPSGFYGIYNIGGEEGFVGMDDNNT